MEKGSHRVAALPHWIASLAGTLYLVWSRASRHDRPGPGQWAIALALSVEVGLFLWLAAAVAVPWTVILVPVLIVASVFAAVLARIVTGRRGLRQWPLAVALGLAMTLNALLTGFLTLILFLVLAQGALSGKGILPFLVTPFILSLAMIMKVGGPLFLALTLVMILAIGVLMDAGPVAFLAVPLVLSVAVGVVLFKAISPDRSSAVRHLPGDSWRPGSKGNA